MIKDIMNKIPSQVEYFNMECPDCHSKNIEIKPIDVSYTKEIINNNDIKNARLKTAYDKVLHISDVLKNDEVKKTIHCSDCLKINRIKLPIYFEDLKKYLKKNKLEKPMVL